MKTFDFTTEYATYKDCYFIQNNYMELEIWNDKDGPIAALTRESLRELFGISSENAAYIDTNNCPWSERLIKELEIGKPTGNFHRSGRCTYPEYEFDMDKLREYMSEEE